MKVLVVKLSLTMSNVGNYDEKIDNIERRWLFRIL